MNGERGCGGAPPLSQPYRDKGGISIAHELHIPETNWLPSALFRLTTFGHILAMRCGT